jgi:pimeloyl-ACP methyl ester carboxylesterase
MTSKRWRKLLIGEFSLRRVVWSVLFIYGAVLLLACFATNWLAFHPPPHTYELFDRITMIPTPDGESLAVIFYPPPNSNSYTLLYSHGNAEDLGFIVPLCEALHELGFGVCAYDYRGYGLSTGAPKERTARQDVLTIYAYLTNACGVAPEQIISHGRSLGSHMALHLATQAPIAGLVLESGFLSGTRVLSYVKIFPFERFDNQALLPQVTCPVLVIHGTGDTVIPIWHGHGLFAQVPEPKRAFWVKGANHNNVIEHAGEEYFVQLRDFADSLQR